MFPSSAENPAKTISREVSLSGISLHSGKESRIIFRPSNRPGIYFIFETGTPA